MMRKFKDIPYERPDATKLEPRLKALIERFGAASSPQEQDGLMAEINTIRRQVDSMFALCQIRHTVDTTNDFYDKENEACDTLQPVFEGIQTEYYRALLGSRFRHELEAKWGAQLFRKAELQMKTFKPEVLEDLQAENRLSSEYVKLKAGAKILFEGQERNLPQMDPFFESTDRAMRRRAQEAISGFYAAHGEDFDRIYDKLVKLRHGIALKLGFPNFVPLAYARLARSDYDARMVANYRKQVLESIVPLASALKRRQALRLGLPALKFHDEGLDFLTGNATPKGDSTWIVERARQMYAEMSPETDEFFTLMRERELMDLETRKGKAGGGYCTFIATEGAPFIFSNFNGTSGDVDVLTHEAGHAFQCLRSAGYEVPEYNWPTLEACEIHSMSMEFFAWPWMGKFFGPDEDKYKFAHLAGALTFIPYGVAVDEFQHWVYENPAAAVAERRAAWRGTERKYLPHRDFDGDTFLENGGYWFRQGHIFESPFYYIDYTLAQVCAFEFWGRSRQDRAAAWTDYLKLCGLGGSLPFTALVREAGLHDPFADGTIGRTLAPIEQWLGSIDDRRM